MYKRVKITLLSVIILTLNITLADIKQKKITVQGKKNRLL